ncbi:MAG TPA: ABC transporter ATP-binding protein [Candidatus Thermoplasmatota archaeon]|nr:ABC transporter ATP-binding protein [Candidatus Thermoplasmatota archaeon]
MTQARQPEQAASVALRLEGVTKAFGIRAAVRDVSLQVPMGSVVALLGPNGAGKSTLLRILAAQSRPDAGRVLVLGRDAWPDAATAREGIVHVAQDAPVFEELRVGEHAHALAAIRAIGRAAADTELADWGLSRLRDRKVAELSRGQRQRLALAAAFAGEPPVLLLDEPFHHLDPAAQQTLGRKVAQRRGRRTSVLVLHDEPLARGLADACYRMQAGTLEAA